MNCYRGVTKGCPTVLRIHILNPDPAKNLNLDPDPRHCHINNIDITFLFYAKVTRQVEKESIKAVRRHAAYSSGTGGGPPLPPLPSK